MQYADKDETIPVYTTTEFRRDSASVYNRVAATGTVIIEHRDRPDMALLTKEHLDNLIEEAKGL